MILLQLDPAHAAEAGERLFEGLRRAYEDRQERPSPEVVALARTLVANGGQSRGQPSPDGDGCACGRQDDLMNTATAAARLGMSRSTLYRRVEAGLLHPIRDGGRFRFHRDDLDRYLERARA